MHFQVNGQPIEIEPRPGEMLVDLLRERLGLTGVKVGCNEAECGACTVLVDGAPTLSCCMPAARADGKHIVTIEGLASQASKAGHNPGDSQHLHPLQQAFILYGAVQCGFCIPGQLMTAYALLQANPDPSPEQIRQALKDTLCRCGGYPTIERAILAAAQAIRNGIGVEYNSTGVEYNSAAAGNATIHSERLIGKHQIRPDAVAKVTGAAVYSDDLHFEGILHAAVKRAGVPHAILRQVDIDKAAALPGVVSILTAGDLPGERTHGLVIPDWPILIGAGERIRYVGDALAIVAAEDRATAQQALELIEIEYDPLPVVSSALQARQPGAPELHRGGNLLKHIKVRKDDAMAKSGSAAAHEDSARHSTGFAQAEVILEHTFNTPTTDHAFIEPECSLARPLLDENGAIERMEIYVGSQIPYSDRNQVARALGWPDERVRVIGQTVGGGFGGKEDIAGQIHAALLAWATRRPVKLLFSRHESLLVHPKRHATQIRVKIGASQDGQLVAVESELFGDTGAYASLGEKVLTRATTHSSGPYEAPYVQADCYAMYTNNPPAGAFRGFGVTQSAFAIESMMDMLAHKLGLDPFELRRRNALRAGSITNTGQTLRDSAGLVECLDRVEAEVKRLCPDHDPFQAQKVEGQPGKVCAWGIAAAYKNTGLGGGAPDKSGAEVELYPNGKLQVRTSAAELGQGLVTVLQMIVAEEFNQPGEQVSVLVMDTDLAPDGGPTTASRQTYVTGNAARYAAQALRRAVVSALAKHFDTPPEEVRFVEGLAQIGNQSVPLGEAAQIMLAMGQQPKAIYEYWAPATQPLGQGGDMHFAFSFAVQAAQVEVNTYTGKVSVRRVVTANDVGRAINPLGLQGQVEGGVMMGIGNALLENFIVEEGRVITDRLARYRIPSIVHTPKIISLVVEHPTAEGPYGAKGVGEIVSIPTTPAITNAIFNAVGIRIDSLPVDQETIVQQGID